MCLWLTHGSLLLIVVEGSEQLQQCGLQTDRIFTQGLVFTNAAFHTQDGSDVACSKRQMRHASERSQGLTSLLSAWLTAT